MVATNGYTYEYQFIKHRLILVYIKALKVIYGTADKNKNHFDEPAHTAYHIANDHIAACSHPFKYVAYDL